MNIIKVNFENLTESERNLLLGLVEKANREQTELFNVDVGKTFKIGDIEFIKFSDEYGVTTAVTKDIICKSEFGKNNNLKESTILKKLTTEFLPKITQAVGDENVKEFITDLTTLDGLKPYGELRSKISLPTFDFYRENVEILDKHKINKWWWLATPDSAKPHYEPNIIVCVAPSGDIDGGNCYGSINGVRPLLCFSSSIFVSCEE